MPTINTKERIFTASFDDFVSSFLPLYSDPHVKIRIGSAGPEYKLSKALLCKQSPYFAATFEGPFQEGEEQSTTSTEIDGVVSVRSFKLLVQWLYLGQVIFGALAPEDEIAAAIEFVRCADMCGVTGMESRMAEHIRGIMVSNPAPPDSKFEKRRVPDTNTYCLRSRNFVSVVLLPEGHPVRCILAAAVVEGYLRCDENKFLKEIQDIPGFSADLLVTVKITLKDLSYVSRGIGFMDPTSGEELLLCAIK